MRARTAMLLAALTACGGSRDASPPPVAGASSAAANSPDATPGGASSVAPVGDTPPPLADDPIDWSRFTPALDADPRLAGARDAVARGALLEAARAVETATPSPADGAGAADRAELLFLAARLRRDAGDPAGANRGFAAAAAAPGPLAPIAHLYVAEAAIEARRADDALAALDAVDARAVSPARLDAARLAAHAIRGDVDAARAIAARLVHAEARPKAWADHAIAAARALLARPGEARAVLALELLEPVRFGASPAKAEAARKPWDEALGRVGREIRARHATPDDATLVGRAESLVVANRTKEATPILDRLAKQRAPLVGELACRAGIARGKALGGTKRLAEASDAWGEAITRCAGDPRLGEALLGGGRAAARAKRFDEARRRLERLEAAFPTSPLADDARLEAGRVALDDGDVAGARRLLGTIGDAYPAGDMVGDGLFALGAALLERGDAAGALAPLEAGRARPIERAWHRAGRFPYFAGRALAIAGRHAEARARWHETISRAPASYYAALAVSRLDALSPGPGREALTRSVEVSPRSPLPVLATADAAHPAVLAALAAARLGDPHGVALAGDALGVETRTAPEATLLVVARALAIAGDTRRAHLVLRTASEVEPRPGRVEAWSMRDAPPAGDARVAWELAYPRPHAPAFAHASRESGVPTALLYAVAREESAFDAAVVSRSDARGLLQLLPVTGRRMARGLGVPFDEKTLFDPAINVRLGARFLGQMQRRFGAAPALCIPGYNAGPGAPDRWLVDRPGWDFDLWVERIPYAETRGYTKRVIGSWLAYAALAEFDAAELPRLPITLPAP